MNTNKIHTFDIEGMPMFVRVIDSTHVSVSFLESALESGCCVYHIAQLDPNDAIGKVVYELIDKYKKGE